MSSQHAYLHEHHKKLMGAEKVIEWCIALKRNTVCGETCNCRLLFPPPTWNVCIQRDETARIDFNKQYRIIPNDTN